VTAYLALLPNIGRDEDAATHAFSSSYLRSSHSGDELSCTATVKASLADRICFRQNLALGAQGHLQNTKRRVVEKAFVTATLIAGARRSGVGAR
jgi:hypothetical protein